MPTQDMPQCLHSMKNVGDASADNYCAICGKTNYELLQMEMRALRKENTEVRKYLNAAVCFNYGPNPPPLMDLARRASEEIERTHDWVESLTTALNQLRIGVEALLAALPNVSGDHALDSLLGKLQTAVKFRAPLPRKRVSFDEDTLNKLETLLISGHWERGWSISEAQWKQWYAEVTPKVSDALVLVRGARATAVSPNG